MLGQMPLQAEGAIHLALDAGGADGVGAAAHQQPARLQQRPGAGDIGPVLRLVLGQQAQSGGEWTGQAIDHLESRLRQPVGGGPEALLADQSGAPIAVQDLGDLRPHQKAPLRQGQQFLFERQDQGLDGFRLAHFGMDVARRAGGVDSSGLGAVSAGNHFFTVPRHNIGVG